jgi:hypothetical protein
VATTQLSYTKTVPNGGVQQPAGTTLVAAPTNDMQLAGAQPEKTVLVVANSDSGNAITITVKAGDYPPAWAAGQGDLAVSIAASKTEYIGPLESGRFIQSDGSMYIQSSATTGTITPLLVSRSA